MSRTAIAGLISEEFDLSKSEANKIVASVFKGIASSLESQGSFSYVGFGRLQVVDRAARQGRNPNSGESLIIAARKVVTFTAGDPLKRQLNATKND